jgi:hypothetical protein
VGWALPLLLVSAVLVASVVGLVLFLGVLIRR